MAVAERGITHGMRFQARALATQATVTDRCRWIAGTTDLREDNEVCVLEFDADTDTLRSVDSFLHKPEVWDIAPSPEDARDLITVHGGRFSATLWRMAPGRDELEARAELACQGGAMRAALWREGGRVATIEDGRLASWQLAESTAEEVGSAAAQPDSPLFAGCWDPNDGSRLATVGGGSLQLWDMRGVSSTARVSASDQPLRDVAFAAHTPHVLSTVGDDARLRVWDLRRTESGPLLALGGHTRWVWRVRHNPVHDSLVLTSSSDCTVGLHYLPSVRGAAAAKTDIPPPPPGKPPPDGRVHTVADHDESVYGVEWSAVDPWVFASLSYDGSVVINRVPSQIKYKILI